MPNSDSRARGFTPFSAGISPVRHGDAFPQDESSFFRNASTTGEIGSLKQRLVNEERGGTLRNLYEDRFRSLSQTVIDTIRHMQDDDVLAALRSDPSSQEFLQARMNEIFDSTLNSERELQLKNVMDRLAQKTDAMNELKREYTLLSHKAQQRDDLLGQKSRLIQQDINNETISRERAEDEVRKIQLQLVESEAKVTSLTARLSSAEASILKERQTEQDARSEARAEQEQLQAKINSLQKQLEVSRNEAQTHLRTELNRARSEEEKKLKHAANKVCLDDSYPLFLSYFSLHITEYRLVC